MLTTTLKLTNKYWEGKVPERHEIDSHDYSILDDMNTFPEKIGKLIEQYKLREALTELMNLARLGNKYLADTEPWKLKKIDGDYIFSNDNKVNMKQSSKNRHGRRNRKRRKKPKLAA